MKTEGKMLTKKQRKAIKEGSVMITAKDVEKLLYSKSKKFKEIKIGSVTLCNPETQEDCRFLAYQDNYCYIFTEYLQRRGDKCCRCKQCKEAFGKQMILTGREG